MAIAAYANKIRKAHSASIKEGLSKTDAPLGNPNAVEVISKVNKIKVEGAVLFALALAPIIEKYEKEGLSQRKIVDKLNHENYMAPEGGKWVLSQYQKVLSRIRTNEVALKLDEKLDEYKSQGYTDQQIIENLNQNNYIPLPNNEQWNKSYLDSIKKRLQVIKHVVNLYKVLDSIGDLLEQFQEDNLSYKQIANELNKRGIDFLDE